MKAPERQFLFTKGINTVQNPADPIEIPVRAASQEVDYECELAVVIGKPCKNVTATNALSYVLGYTCANDVSARDWQLKWGGGQWCKGKTFDTFSPLGPCLVTNDEIPDLQRPAPTLGGKLSEAKRPDPPSLSNFTIAPLAEDAAYTLRFFDLNLIEEERLRATRHAAHVRGNSPALAL